MITISSDIATINFLYTDTNKLFRGMMFTNATKEEIDLKKDISHAFWNVNEMMPTNRRRRISFSFRPWYYKNKQNKKHPHYYKISDFNESFLKYLEYVKTKNNEIHNFLAESIKTAYIRYFGA